MIRAGRAFPWVYSLALVIPGENRKINQKTCYNVDMSKTKIVIVGNGFGGIFTLKYLHKYLCGKSNIEISLIGPKNYFLFTPLLHEVATGGGRPENNLEPIRKVLGCCLAEFYLGRA